MHLAPEGRLCPQGRASCHVKGMHSDMLLLHEKSMIKLHCKIVTAVFAFTMCTVEIGLSGHGHV